MTIPNLNPNRSSQPQTVTPQSATSRATPAGPQSLSNAGPDYTPIPITADNAMYMLMRALQEGKGLTKDLVKDAAEATTKRNSEMKKLRDSKLQLGSPEDENYDSKKAMEIENKILDLQSAGENQNLWTEQSVKALEQSTKLLANLAHKDDQISSAPINKI